MNFSERRCCTSCIRIPTFYAEGLAESGLQFPELKIRILRDKRHLNLGRGISHHHDIYIFMSWKQDQQKKHPVHVQYYHHHQHGLENLVFPSQENNHRKPLLSKDSRLWLLDFTPSLPLSSLKNDFPPPHPLFFNRLPRIPPLTTRPRRLLVVRFTCHTATLDRSGRNSHLRST